MATVEAMVARSSQLLRPVTMVTKLAEFNQPINPALINERGAKTHNASRPKRRVSYPATTTSQRRGVSNPDNQSTLHQATDQERVFPTRNRQTDNKYLH